VTLTFNLSASNGLRHLVELCSKSRFASAFRSSVISAHWMDRQTDGRDGQTVEMLNESKMEGRIIYANAIKTTKV